MSKMIGLKFILEGGAWMAVLLSEEEANKVMSSWVSREFKVKDNRVLHGTGPDGDWAVLWDAIQGIHRFTPPEQQQAQYPVQRSLPSLSPFPPYQSGL